jgi:hypothetical protein
MPLTHMNAVQVVYVDAMGTEFAATSGPGRADGSTAPVTAASSPAAKPAAASSTSPAASKAEKPKAAAPKGKSKKAAAANTKGIASFFGKK